MITQNGDVFTLGSQYNRDGRLHLKSLGDGAYAFEDLAADQASDFDYNDAVLVIRRRSSSAPMDPPNPASRAYELDRNVASALRPRDVPMSLANSDAFPGDFSNLASRASALDRNVASAPRPRDVPRSTANSDASPGDLAGFDTNALARAITSVQVEVEALQIQPLNCPDDGASLQAPSFAPIRQGDALTMWDRGELRVAIPSHGKDPATLLSYYNDLLTAVTTSLGKAKLPLHLVLLPYSSASEVQEQLSTGQVDLVLADDNDLLCFDGVAGLDSLTLTHSNPTVLLVTQTSGINSFDDLAGSRLGFTSDARISTTLAQTLSRHEATATVRHFPDLQQACDALRIGHLDGLLLMQASVPAVQDWLVNNGIDSQVLPEILLESRIQLFLAMHQSLLRNLILAALMQLH
jgi:hypothetical protein